MKEENKKLLVNRLVFDPEQLYPGRSIRVWGYDAEGDWTDILGMIRTVQGAQLYVMTLGPNGTVREVQICISELELFEIEVYGPDRYELKVPFDSEQEDEVHG